MAGMTAEEVYCPFDSIDFDEAAARRNIEKMQKVLKDNPNAVFEIDAFCDAVGTKKYNDLLGQDRGEALQDFYEANGIPQGHIVVVDHGKDGPQEKQTADQIMEPMNRGIRTTVQSGGGATPAPAVEGGPPTVMFRGLDFHHDRERGWRFRRHDHPEEGLRKVDNDGHEYFKRNGINLNEDGTATNSSGYRLKADGSPTGEMTRSLGPTSANRPDTGRLTQEQSRQAAAAAEQARQQAAAQARQAAAGRSGVRMGGHGRGR